MGLLDQVAKIILHDEFSGTFAKLNKQQAQAGTGFNQMGNAASGSAGLLSRLGGVAGTMGLAIGVAGVAATAKAAISLGNLGAESLRTKAIFASLTGGSATAADLMGKLREASGNTASGMALMQATMTPLIGVTAELRSAFVAADPTLLALAKAVSDTNPALGTATELYAQFGEGLRKGVPKALESAGLVIEQKTVFEAFARSLGTTSEKLTDAQRSQALLNDVMRQAPGIISRIGTTGDVAAESSERLTRSFGRFKIMLAEELAPAVTTFQSNLADALDIMAIWIGGSDLDKLKSSLKENQKSLEAYTGWVGKTAEAERQRQAVVQALTATMAQQKAEIGAMQRVAIAEQRHAAIEAAKTTAVTISLAAANENLRWSIMNAGNASADFAKKARLGGDGLIYLSRAANVARSSMAGLSAEYKAFVEDGRSFIISVGVTGGLDNAEILANITKFQRAAAQIELDYGPGNSVNKQIAQGKLREQFSQMETDFSSSLGNMASAADDTFSQISSMIESELQPSFSLKDLAPDLATSEGNIDEHYRRLAAIALRGGEEIAAHQLDWQDTLALIPADTQAQGVAAMQEWAKAQVVGYDQGLNFAWIDKDAIKNRILKQLNANEARDAIVAEIAASMAGVSLLDVQAAAGDAGLGKVGAGAKVSIGVEDSVDVDAMLRATAAAITTGATEKYSKALRESGGVVGGVILGGITSAVVDGASDIINKLAAAIAPSVIAAIEARNRKAGGVPPP